VPRLSTLQEQARRRIIDVASRGLAIDRLPDLIMRELQRAIPIDGYRLFGIDPATRLVNRVLAASANDGWARLEYLQTIYLAFGPEVYSELSNVLKAGIPVAVFDEDQSICFGYPRSMLAAMTPKEHYRLFHEMSSPPGGGIQVAFSAHGQVIAALQIYRREMRSAFRASDVAFLRVVAPIISDALSAALARERAMRASTEAGSGSSGVLVLGASGQVQYATPEGERWSDLLLSAEGAIDGPLPTAIWAAIAKLRSGADVQAVGSIAVESPSGLVRVEATAARDGDIAVVMTPMQPPALPEIPPGWLLTRQEREVVKLVLRGASNRSIGEALSISDNTVETHLRHIYEKLDVRGRGELLARFFQEMFYPGIESETDTTSH
jgi:DNA-binding CsgD family transcriptional regulator